MFRFVCLLAVLLIPLAAHAEYDPTAPSEGAKAVEKAAKEAIIPAPVKKKPVDPNAPKDGKPALTPKQKFKKFDADNSGFLSYREFVLYSGRTKLEDIGLQKRFLRLDKDLDRKLSEDELKNP